MVSQQGGAPAAGQELEPIVEVCGDRLNSEHGISWETIEIVAAVGSPRVAVLYDLYHSLVMGEDPAAVLDGSTGLVAHVQVADVAGRSEPRSGPLDWPRLLHDLRAAGYHGRLGLEYMPSVATVESLALIETVAAGA